MPGEVVGEVRAGDCPAFRAGLLRVVGFESGVKAKEKVVEV